MLQKVYDISQIIYKQISLSTKRREGRKREENNFNLRGTQSKLKNNKYIIK